MVKCFLCKTTIPESDSVLAIIERAPEVPRFGHGGRKMTVSICLDCKDKSNVIRYKTFSPWYSNLHFKTAYSDDKTKQSFSNGGLMTK